MAATLRDITISAAMTKSQLEVAVSAVTNITVGMIAVVNGEAMLVNKVDASNTKLGLQRGYAGTKERKHASGSVMWVDRPEYFSTDVPSGQATATEEVALPRMVLPAGYTAQEARCFRIVNDSWVEVSTHRLANHRCSDPDTGYEYLLVDCQSSFLAGEWCVVNPEGLASQLAASSKGRVAIIVETVSASDTLSWALVVGKYASTNTTSDVTTAADMVASTGTADILTSTGGNILWGAACTVAPSTATSPGLGGGVATVYVNNPWVSGEVHSFSSIGT